MEGDCCKLFMDQIIPEVKAVVVCVCVCGGGGGEEGRGGSV